MEENVFADIDAIDAALDKEFGEVANKPDEETANEEPITDNTDVENANTTADENTKEENPQENTNEEVNKVEDKKSHAFADLRAENGNLKKERDEYKSDSDFLKELASSYGYSDTTTFQEALKVAKYKKEAQEKGYDEALYEKTMKQEARIAQLEKEREQEIFDRKVERFKNALEKTVSKYEVEEQEIFDRLEKAGISVDEILSISNPTLLLDGILVDKIQNKAKQNQINDIQNMKGLVEDKNEQNVAPKSVTIDDLLKNDIAKYKKENFFN